MQKVDRTEGRHTRVDFLPICRMQLVDCGYNWLMNRVTHVVFHNCEKSRDNMDVTLGSSVCAAILIALIIRKRQRRRRKG